MHEKELKLAGLPLSIPTFENRKRAASKGINPQTGAKITITVATTPVLRADKALKEEVK